MENWKLEWEKIKEAFSKPPWNIDKNWRIVDVGAGGNPLIRADVICDLYDYDEGHYVGGLKEAKSYPWQTKVFNVNAENMYVFGDKEFDGSYWSHNAEHLISPGKGCEEIMRISKGGLIGVPSTMHEILVGIKDGKHRWFIELRHNILTFIEKDITQENRFNAAFDELKKSEKIDEKTEELINKKFRKKLESELILRNPKWLYFKWQNNFSYQIIRDCSIENKICHFENLEEFNPGYLVE